MPSQLFSEDPSTRTSRECLRWLPAHAVGHVGATVAGLPVVVPLPYQRRDEVLYVLVSDAPSLQASLAGAIVAFSAPAQEPATGLAWSVLAIGPTVEVAPEEAGRGAFGALDAPGGVFRLTPQLVTARPGLLPETR